MPTRDEMIAALKANSSKKPSREQMIASLKGEPLDVPGAEEDGSFLEEASKTIDSYTSAPFRAAVSAVQHKKNPFTAAIDQFGEDPSLTADGYDIAKKGGVPDVEKDVPVKVMKPEEYLKQQKMINPGGPAANAKTSEELSAFAKADGIFFPGEKTPTINPAKVAGFGINVGLDPTLLIPAGAVSKVAKTGAGMVAKGAKIIPGFKKAEAVGTVIKDATVNSAEAIKKMFSPSVADDFNELKNIATKNGIDSSLLPESIEFGQNSVITRAARNRAEGPLGEAFLKKFEDGLDAVKDATDYKIAKIGGGSIPSSVEAGEVIRKGYDKGVEKIFDSIGMTHNKVLDSMPGLTLSPESFFSIESKLAGLEKWAKGRELRGFTNAQRAQGTQVLRAIEAARAGNGSYKQTLETLRDIGEVAFQSKNILADIPPDVKKFRELYFSINDGLIETVRKTAGNPVADELLESNKIITELMGDKSIVAGIIGNKNMSPEKVFASLIEHGDTNKIKALKKILPPEEFQKLKGSFLASQIKRTADDSFSFKSLHNNLRGKKHVMAELLDAGEISEISDLIRLGDRFGERILSTSGTGASGLFSNIRKGIQSGIENDTVIGYLKNSARNKQTPPTPNKVPGISSTRSLANQIQGLTGESLLKINTQANKFIEMGTSKNIEDALKYMLELEGGVKEVKNIPKTYHSANNLKRLAYISPAAVRILGAEPKDDGSGGAHEVKGESKWALDGFSKMLDHDKSGLLKNPKVVEEMLASPKGKQLLINASSLKPGSKAMEDILIKIKSQYGGS